MHLTETCEDDLPHLITQVETMNGPTADGAAPPKIPAALQRRSLLSGTHLVDTGFLDAELLIASQDNYGVGLLGPTRLDDPGPARQGPALMPHPSRSIGASRTRAVRPARRGSVGHQPSLIAGILSSR